MASSGVSGSAIALALAGSLLVYSGVKGKKFSVVLRDVIAGKNPSTSATDPTLGIVDPVTGQGVAPGLQSNPAGPVVGPVVAGSAVTANQAIGKVQAALYGWAVGPEWDALVALWNKESGWRNTADTRVSGAGGDGPGSPVFAYGIAQARPATKYPLPGRPPDLGGIADPTTQIAWGLSYIRSVYGDPLSAWAHEQSNNWY